jgi:uncharacterized spore protein YtfJ
MDLKEFVSKGQETMTVRRVFGEPYVQNGVTVVPAARIRGAVGGGGGDDKTDTHQGEGEGGGLMINATPVGVYVIRGEKVTWVPSFDLNRVIFGAQITAVVALIVSRLWAPRTSLPHSRFKRRQFKTAGRREARRGAKK